MQAILGLILIPCFALVLSVRRQHIPIKTSLYAVLLQAVLAVMMLFVPPLRALLNLLSQSVSVLQSASDAGAQFMFGFLAGGVTPYEVVNPSANFVVAFRVLPLILLISVLSAVLFHWNILPRIIQAFSWVLQRTLKLSGVLGFAAASSVFMGIIESPVLIKPYLKRISSSDLFALMTCGMSTVAGTVMVLYASLVETSIPDALTHILVASVMSVPAAILIAQIMVPPNPEEAMSDHQEQATLTYTSSSSNTMEAVLKGLNDGIKMVVSIAAILVVLFALVHLVNQGLAWIPSWDQERPMSLGLVLGQVMRPVMWIIGIPWSETGVAGELMATKTLLNEFVAYQQLSTLADGALSESSRKTMLYAMCGFANLGSLGILSGGLGAIVPERQAEITSLAARAVVSGTLTTLMTGAMVHLIFQAQSLVS